MNKLVSVIIPCYKDSKTLSRAIESVLCQTYSPIELIVINDCSPETRGIEECVKKYPGLKYFRNKKNIGLAATRNNGIEHASGEIVAFLDADDEYHKDKIKIQMEFLQENSVVTCGVINVLPAAGLFVEKRLKDALIIYPSEILFSNKLNGAGILAPKSLILRVGGYNANLRSCEDFDLWLRLLTIGIKVKVLGIPLYYYHYNAQGLSKNYRNISYWEIEVLKLHAARMGRQWFSSWRYAFLIMTWLLKHLVRSELARDSELRTITLTNATLLDNFTLMRRLLIFMAYLRLPVIVAFFLRHASREVKSLYVET